MLKLILTSFFFIIFTSAIAQTYEKEYVTLFAYEVKQVDDFIDRFNGKDSTLFRLYYKKHNSEKQLTREQLIKSLFNGEGKNWNYNDINAFISTVNNKDKPQFLNFFDNKWYAKLNCSVTWKGKPRTATLKLKVEKDENGGFKWIITGVNAKFLLSLLSKGDNKNYVSFKLPAPRDSTTSLDPSSNDTEFMNIDRVSSDKVNISNYFYKSDTYKDQLPLFVTECLNGHLVIDQVNSIHYYFDQIKGWSFEIKQYNRRTKNSGWLISSLVKVNAGE